MWMIIYQAYGTWKLSGLFESEARAIEHRDRYITTKDKDYNINVEIRYVELQMLRLEPEWWEEARKLKAQGLTYTQIHRATGRSRRAIRYALDPAEREICINRSKRLYREGTAVKSRDKRSWKEKEARRYARDKFRKEGGDLRQIYKELGCL